MKYLKLFALAAILAFSANVYSQWTFVLGSTNLIGLGATPFLSAVDQNTVWVCGGTGGLPKVYRSTNGGANFTNVTGSLTGPEFYAIWAVDANTCIVGDGGAVGGAGGNAKLWRTTDAGVTWTNVLTTGAGVGFWNGICGLQNNRNWMYAQSDQPSSGGCITAVSTNGGANWTVTQTSTAGTIGAAGSIWASSTTVYGNGMSTTAKVSITTNGGSSWTGPTLSVAGTFTSGFAAGDDGQFMIAGTSTSLPSISRSTNFGSTWSTVNVGGTISGLCVMKWVQGTNGAYLSGATGTNPIRRSTDGGATWTTMTTGGITGFNDLSFVMSGGVVYGYAIATDGSVVKVADNTFTAIDPNNTNVPSKFELEQNYPNPFNPSTTIKYSVPVAGNVTVKIFNSLGVEVMTVANGNHTAGNYVENVDMSGFSSGVYFYTMTAGDYKETRKMMLIK